MKIAIAGFGVEGEENYKYWSSDPTNELVIVDERTDTAREYPYGAATLWARGVLAPRRLRSCCAHRWAVSL